MEPRHNEQVGSVAEEAIKLVQALTSANHTSASHTSSNDPGADHPGSNRAEAGTADAAGEHAHPDTCQWCPLCRLVNTIRDNPDAVEAVVTSASSLAHSMKSFLETATQSGPKDHS